MRIAQLAATAVYLSHQGEVLAHDVLRLNPIHHMQFAQNRPFSQHCKVI